METFSVRKLETTDIEALLRFETNNREWFESHIDARDPSFYSLQGVRDHVESYLADFAVGAWHPFVIEASSGVIVGRANLKSINSPQGCAEVGYRIDQRYCAKGLATLAVKHLIQEAQTRWRLTQLIAQVYQNNIGSRKVLSRCGFQIDQESESDQAQGESRFMRSI